MKWQTRRWTKDKERNLKDNSPLIIKRRNRSDLVPATPFCKTPSNMERQHDGGNRTKSLWEANLPLRGSLRVWFSDFFCEVYWGFQRISEVFFWGFQKFSEVVTVFWGGFWVFWEVLAGDPLRGRFPSQRLSVLLPLIVLPRGLSLKMLGSLQIDSQSGPCLTLIWLVSVVWWHAIVCCLLQVLY